MEEVFRALADHSRRDLLDRLFEQQGQTLGELCENMNMRRQSVSGHLAILERAGLVSVQWHGREKRHYMNPMPIAEIADRWIDKFSRHKTRALLQLKQALEHNAQEK